MPPGSRKRKAAKKKKEQETTIHSTTNSQGNHDLKTHDEKGSDSGDISSPRSEDHHHPSVEEEEEGKEEKRDSSSFGSVAAANSKPMEGTQNGAGDGEGEIKQMVVSEEVEVLQVDGEMKPGEDLESKDVSIEYVQYAKDSRVGGSSGDAGSSSSGSSSSDDESRLVEKNSLVIETGKLEEEEKSDGLIIETVPPVDSVPLTEEMTEAVETTMVSNTVVSDAIDVASKVKEEIWLPSSQEAAGVSGVIDLVSNGNEEKILQASDAPTVDTSNDGGGEHREESDIPVGSENQQPQLVLAPPTVPPTSWKSCCGLFDVLWGSNR